MLTSHLFNFRIALSQPTRSTQPKKEHNLSLHLTKTKKTIIATSLVIVILVSCFAFYPRGDADSLNTTDPTASPSSTPISNTSTSPTNNTVIYPSKVPPTLRDPLSPTVTPTPDTSWQVVTNANPVNNDTWRAIAKYAWNYFAVDTGVDSTTGLPGSSSYFSAFTDWDLGVYIQAVMDAKTIGIIDAGGDWGSSARLDKIMTFLEKRELNSTTGYPYWFYTSNGTNYNQNSDKAPGVDIVDTGRLFVALNNLKSFNSSLATRIDNLVYNTGGNRSNYAALLPSIKADAEGSYSIYAYYFVSGFASFWPNELATIPPKILNNIFASGTVKYGNVSLPVSNLLCDPLYCAVFEIKNNPVALISLAQTVYAAHETYYNITGGTYRAFGEGPSFSGDWAYEWVMNDNITWVIKINNQDSNMSPIIYTKTAFCFLSLYNTTFAKSMVSYLEVKQGEPRNGYYSGTDENGDNLPDTNLHTNAIILEAARYSIQNNK